MKIKTKLTLLIGGGMMTLSIIFLLAGTVFSIHEVLLVKRHELKIIARRIDLLLQEAPDINIQKLRGEIESGLRFNEKKKNLDAAVFGVDGRLLYVSSGKDSMPGTPDESVYPSKTGDHTQHVQWVAWNLWRIDFFYRGSNCLVQMNLIQRLEIQEDMSTFFFGSLAVSIILSLLGGRIITSNIMKRAGKIEKAADEIASGNLAYRIPESAAEDEMRRIEQNLNGAFEELEKSFRNIMEFSSDIAHELRTPLTIMSGGIEVALAESRTPAEYQRTLAGILEEIALLRRIIDDMLILVKPESAYKTTFEPIDISAEVTDILHSISIMLDSRRMNLKQEIEDNCVVSGVKSLIHLIFSNLIYNAVKYTPEAGTITVSLKRKKNIIEFFVSDTGPGIPESEHEKIFIRFYRTGGTSGGKGTGLGLAIVRKVCAIHRATVSVESVSGSGSTFTVSFPSES